MGRSFSAAIPGPPLQDFYHQLSNTHFSMLNREGRYFQRRWQVDSDGKQINVDEKRIDFVMGSGNHVRTFLHRTATGALQELPLAWYSERGGSWAMNPGYDTPIQPNSRRKVSYECMFCHNAYPEIPTGHEQLRAEPIFAAIPNGIDCQRCHGPAQHHVELARSPRPSFEAVRAAVVNPARLGVDRQMEVCAQCHLESDSFPFPASILKYDRGQFSYKPGEPLADFALFFDHAPSKTPDDRFQIVNSVYRLRMSACFLKSDAKLKCTTCHDPHDSDRSTASYNGVCRQCHVTLTTSKTQHTASPDCIACHMPKRRTDDVIHAVMTDHFIQRRKPDRDLLAEIPEPHGPDIIYRGEVVRYDLPNQGSQDELYLALAQVREDNNSQRGLARLSEAIQKYRPKEANFYVELADAFVKSGQPARAVPLYKDAIERNPKSLAAELGLGAALEKSGDLSHAVDAFVLSTKLAPRDANTWWQLGEAQLKLGQDAEGAAALKKSLELDPEVPETHYALATLRQRSGDLAGAAALYKEAIRLQPAYSAAHMNLAILLFQENHTPAAAKEAEEHFKSALWYHPDYALGHYNFGLMLIAQGRLSEAKRELESALQPGSPASSNLSAPPSSAPSSALDAITRAAALQRLSDLGKRH